MSLHFMKKIHGAKKVTIDLSVFYSIYRKHLKILYHTLKNFFSKYQIGFRKGFNLKTCLEVIIEKLRNYLDDGVEYAASLTDLSKAFGCLSLELIF